MSDYQKVSVKGFPGYADFEGELILDSADWPIVVVGFIWEGKPDWVAVERDYVEVI